MSIEERQKFDIELYIPYFKKFNLFLGISLFIIATFLLYFVNPDWSAIFLGTYPIISYTFFIWKSYKFYIEKTKKQKFITFIAMSSMLILLTLIILEFNNTLIDNKIEIVNNKLEIHGGYGCEIHIKDIKSITLENKIPEIKSKINGANLNIIKKGYFNTKENEKVKLLINSNKTPILLITTTDEKKIYFSSKEKSNIKIYKELIEKIK